MCVMLCVLCHAVCVLSLPAVLCVLCAAQAGVQPERPAAPALQAQGEAGSSSQQGTHPTGIQVHSDCTAGYSLLGTCRIAACAIQAVYT